MKTFLILGTGVITGMALEYLYLNYKDRLTEWIKYTNKKIPWPTTLPETREVDSISMKTFGSWVKEHDFPNFEGYKFFVLKDKFLPISSKNSKETHRYGFCITDVDFNIIDACIYESREVDSTFAAKITKDVSEIVIK